MANFYVQHGTKRRVNGIVRKCRQFQCSLHRRRVHCGEYVGGTAEESFASDRRFTGATVFYRDGNRNGKTYVYTKTIYELNRLYGFTKFIVVVPSEAIREGVYKSSQATEEHFPALYDNAPCRYFIYNSAKLSDVRQFATSANIEIMIINIDAFRKVENVINQQQGKLNGEAAINYIQATRPLSLSLMNRGA